MQPGHLFVSDPKHTLAAFQDKTITLERIQPLLDRGFHTKLLLAQWQRAHPHNYCMSAIVPS